MTSALAPPDVEGALVNLLGARTRVPNPRPAEWSRVTRAGGNQRNLIQSDTRVLVECWGPDETAAFDRARLAWARLGQAQKSFIAAGVWVGRVQLGDPVNFPDPDTKSPRYQFVAQLTVSLTDQEIPT